MAISTSQSNMINNLSRKVDFPNTAQNFSAGDQTSNQDTYERSIVSSQFRRVNGEI